MLTSMDLKKRLENVKDRISKAALKCSRNPEDIHLVAVSKTIPADRVWAHTRCHGILSDIYSPTRPNTQSGFLI
jgi:hypothetical protein